MGTYVSTKTDTKITDLSQIAEGEVIAGVGSTVGLPGSVTVGQGGAFTVTGANADKVIGGLVSNMDSTVGRLLGVTEQLAQGIFEIAPAAAAEAISQTQGLSTTKLSDIGTQQKESSKNMMLILGGAVLLFLFWRR